MWWWKRRAPVEDKYLEYHGYKIVGKGKELHEFDYKFKLDPVFDGEDKDAISLLGINKLSPNFYTPFYICYKCENSIIPADIYYKLFLEEATHICLCKECRGRLKDFSYNDYTKSSKLIQIN